jgi:hypothetical protein
MIRMRAGERWTYWAGLLAAGVVLLSSGVAYAEPGVSTAHVPWLWFGAVIGALLVGMLPLVIGKAVKTPGIPRVYWVASVVLALLFLLFAGPIIVILGSILITGRTM